MLNRIKTLPLPTIAKARRTATSIRTATLPADDGAAVSVLGDGAEAENARMIVDSLALPQRRPGVAQVVLATLDSVPAERDPRAPGVAPEAWLIARAGTTLAPVPGLAGIVIDPVSSRVIHALLAECIDPRDIAEGSQPDGRPSRSVLVAATVLEDSEKFQQQIASAFGADECHIWIREAADMRPVDPSSRRGDGAPPAAVRLAADTGLPVVVDDGRTVSTWLAVWCARTGGEEPTGVLALRRDGVSAWRGHLAELDLVSARLAVELSWLRVHRRMIAEQERLRAAAMIEPLTGGWTRAAFERTVEVELAGARRRGEVLSMVLFDIDELRRINDQYGHAAGDAALAHVATVIRANVRVNDELGRFGDDELAVLLMNADLERSKMVAEKLVNKIQDAPLVVNGQRIRFGVRAGVTQLDVHTERNGDAGFTRAIAAVDTAARMSGRVAICTEASQVAATALDEDAQVGTLIGTTLGGGYRIVHEINHGASGVVYRGEDLGLGRPVAIKVLRHDLGRDAALIGRFRREASILASLRHPNLVQVYAFGASDDVYFVMELVEGPTIADVVEDAVSRGEWLDHEGVAEMVTEIADALEAMHAAGLVHCDVKPENVILDRHAGRAVLVDVGECKSHDEARRRAGTPNYAAPESFSEGDETALVDVYSLAATAYMALTAQLPFGAGDALAILSRQLDAPPPAPSSIRSSLPEAVDVVILKAMSVEPSQRYATPGGFAAALRSALRGASKDRAVAMPELAGQLRELTIDEEMLAELQAVETVPMVRGAAFRVALKVLAARVGEPWLRRVAEVRRDLAEVLQPALPPMSWQPLESLLDLVASATGDVDDGEVCRSIGRGLISVTFGHLYGADPTSMSTHGLLTSVPRFWSRYFGSGNADIVGAGDHQVVLAVTDWTTSEPAAELVAGVFERIAELTGVTEVRVSIAHDGDVTTFTVEWSDEHRN